jgi:hypothetical protein
MDPLAGPENNITPLESSSITILGNTNIFPIAVQQLSLITRVNPRAQSVGSAVLERSLVHALGHRIAPQIAVFNLVSIFRAFCVVVYNNLRIKCSRAVIPHSIRTYD